MTLSQSQHFFELVNESVMTRSMEGLINFWNHSAEELYGWRKEEALGRVSHDLLQRNSRSHWRRSNPNSFETDDGKASSYILPERATAWWWKAGGPWSSRDSSER